MNKQTNTLLHIKQTLVVWLVLLNTVSPAPQYSDQTGNILGENLDVVNDIFGIGPGETNIGAQSEESVAQGVRNEDGYIAPDDYHTSDDQVFDKCGDYANQGYDCVPYYQCHNGSIIT